MTDSIITGTMAQFFFDGINANGNLLALALVLLALNPEAQVL